MGEKEMTELTLKEILENFKPAIKKEEFDLLLEHMKLTKTEFWKKYKGVTTQRFSQLKTIKIEATLELRNALEGLRSEKIEFEIEPSAFGFSKTCEILLCSKESDIINIQKRKTETGIFLWKTTVKIPDIGEFADKWLSWSDGKINLTDLGLKNLYTQSFDINKILNEREGLSDIVKSQKTRILISESVYFLLKKQKKVFYCLSIHGNTEFDLLS